MTATQHAGSGATGPAQDSAPFDLVGVGFGPGNLGLAIAAAEHPAPLRVRFLERQDRFGWHRGMLIPEARMQIPFVKDLATVRNPTSGFGFLSYLAERGRLVDFLNRQTFFPTRLEYHDYLSWAAEQFDDVVDYGSEVVEVGPGEVGDSEDGPVLDIVARRDGRTVRHRAYAVVIATGLRPHLPPGVTSGDRVWHNCDLVPNVARLQSERRIPRRFVVVGAGQSAAESIEFLHRSFPGAEVHAVFDRWGFSPADDSAFANRVFDPDAAHDFHRSPPHVRRQIVERHRNTNYAVVDPDLIESIYEKHYAELVDGDERLHFHPMSRVEQVDLTSDGPSVVVWSGVKSTSTVIAADTIVYATGYQSSDPARFLRGITPRRDDQGRVDIGANYRLALDGTEAPVYVQGATEHTHGLGSTLLSNIAVRTGEIIDSIVEHRLGQAERTTGRQMAPS
ncbi:lysine N(6)-hydroxylase/L-ornithine N(5)-oxygenase family protein [Protofrankia symbiont of Coriaria ruscifolia]|uniref:lysine N(6)-hydroxylase/L-ornithine N(5)-oxygenase family protein n=1 Tax=Protofrankia symbiont of Coriaria ruscifolia TaxID=1306542 RepID=UPI001040E649|nr:SidA/IucD/PvdA family monooxygenase [Protofrankia symbiont of Coriaria ruscifolia]